MSGHTEPYYLRAALIVRVILGIFQLMIRRYKMEKTINITSVEQAKGKTGAVYYKVATQFGEMTCFAEVIEPIKAAWAANKPLVVDVIENGQYLNIKSVSDSAKPSVEVVKMTPAKPAEPTTHTIMNKTDKANSYEYGKAGNRVKIYFNDVIDLVKNMDELKQLGIGLDTEELPEK